MGHTERFCWDLLHYQDAFLADLLSTAPEEREQRSSAIGGILADRFISFIKALTPDVVLDLGAGDGSFSSQVKKALPDTRVVAFDPSAHDDAKDGTEIEGGSAGSTDAFVGGSGRPAGPGSIEPAIARSHQIGGLNVEPRTRSDVRLDALLGALAERTLALRFTGREALAHLLDGGGQALGRALAILAVVSHENDDATPEAVGLLGPRGFVPIAKAPGPGAGQCTIAFANCAAADQNAIADFVKSFSSATAKIACASLSDRKKTFTHLIVTRFGVGITDPAWYDYRLPLFEATVYSSLLNQTCKDFTWRVMIDERLPKAIVEKIDGLKSRFPQMTTVRVNEITSPGFSADGLSSDWLLSSRIDDDDALDTDTIAILHDRANAYIDSRSVRDALFTFPRGLEIDLVSATVGEFVFPCHSMSVHVLSKGGSKHCFSHSHTKYRELALSEGMHYAEIDPEIPKWIYFRHKLVDSNLHKVSDRSNIQRAGFQAFSEQFGVHLSALDRFVEIQSRVVFSSVKGTRKIAERKTYVENLRPIVRKLQREIARRQLDRETVDSYNTAISEYSLFCRSAMPKG